MSALLEVRDLRKRYRQVQAVDGVSFDVAEGICFGLLGPNGAGKSTTVEMLEGLSPPTSGSILFRGGALGPDYRERIGIQFQHTALQDYLTVRENLRFFRALYARARSPQELVEPCHLGEFLDRDARQLSGGQRQRLLLAIALINDPELIFLDEPTTGLDPQARRAFWELIDSIKRSGKTVVLTTHYMEEAQTLCDDIAIMDHGRIIARGTPQQLLARHFDDVVLELPVEEMPRDVAGLCFQRRNGLARLTTGDVNGVLRALLGAGVALAHLKIRPRTLEDLFIELTGRDLRA